MNIHSLMVAIERGKIQFFRNYSFECRVPKVKRTQSEENFFEKTLILAFEVIEQPPKHTFEIEFFCRVLSHCVVYV